MLYLHLKASSAMRSYTSGFCSMPSMHSPVPTTLLGGLHIVAVAQPSTTCGSAAYMPADKSMHV